MAQRTESFGALGGSPGPVPGRVIVFANPIAGRGRGARLASAVARRLEVDGVAVAVHAERPESIDLRAELSATDDGPVRAAVVIGGDGTLRAVAERLLEATGEASAECPPVMVVPLGTANLMGRHLGAPSGKSPLDPLGLPDPVALVERFAADFVAPLAPLAERWASPLLGPAAGVIAGGVARRAASLPFGPRAAEARLADAVARAVARRRVVALDAATANGRLFLLMAGVGLDAHVVHALDAVRTGPIAQASYLVPAALALRDYAYPRLTVFADGRRVFGPAPALAFVGNVPEYGTGFPVLPRARSDDGRLDLCVLPCRSPEQVARLFLHAAAGEHLSGEGVVSLTGTRFTIDADRPTPVQVDGEPAGHTPLEVRLLDRRLPLIVP